VRTLFDILAFLAIIIAFFVLEALGEGSSRNPLTWILTIVGAYGSHLLINWIYSAKPRWQTERESQEQSKVTPPARTPQDKLRPLDEYGKRQS
jgi:hypothetical protein